MEETHQSRSGVYSRIEGFVFLLLSLSAIVYSLVEHQRSKVVWQQSPYLFPLVVAMFLLPLSLSLLRSAGKENKGDTPALFLVRDTTVVVLATMVYVILMPYLTFLVSTTLFLFGLLFYLGERRYLFISLLSVGFTSLMYLLFGKLLHVMLP